MQKFFQSFRDEKTPIRTNDDFKLIDYYANIDSKSSLKTPKTKSIFRKCVSYLKNDIAMIVFYLALLGAATSTASMAADWCIDNTEKAREFISTRTSFYMFNFILYTIYTLLFAFASVASVQYISTFASGSGVPQMKSMIGGIIMDRYLSFTTLTAKVLGLISGYAAGLSIGKEGPFCHIAGCISHLLLKLPWFGKIRKNDVERRQMLAAACAAGIASVFGAPFGGVLFAIEITATYFPVGNLWKSLLTALTSSLLFTVWRFFGIKGTQQFTEFEEHSYEPYEYLFFGLEGIVMGLLGAFFVAGSLFVVRYQSISLFKGKPFRVIALFTLFSSFFCFHLDPGLKGTTNKILSYMYRLPLDQWNVPNPMLHLIIACIGKYFLTMCAVVMPIPSGVFTPCFITGASIGRLFGESIAFFCRTVGLSPTNPLGYSVVGAAAFASGVTRTLSTGVIMFEITGQIRFLVPTLVATVIALPVGNFFNRSFYSEMMDANGIPNPEFTHLASLDSTKTVTDLMRRTFHAFTAQSTVKECNEIMLKNSHDEFYPILDSMESKILMGVVTHAKMDVLLTGLEQGTTIVFENGSQHETMVPERITCEFDASPFILMAHTNIERVRYLFGILSLSSALVVDHGKLVGIVHKRDLLRLVC